jgi:hypothetical protein
MVQQAQEKAGQLVDQAKDQVKTQLSSQKERAAGTLGSVAEALRQTGENLRQGEQAPVGDLASSAANWIDQFSGSLRDKDVDQMLAEAESFARRNPTVFIGSAFALGFLAARFLKSSSADLSPGLDTDFEGTMRPGTASYRREHVEHLRPEDRYRRTGTGYGGTGTGYASGMPASYAGVPTTDTVAVSDADLDNEETDVTGTTYTGTGRNEVT